MTPPDILMAVDPGSSGAIAMYLGLRNSPYRFERVFDIPTTVIQVNKKKRTIIDAPGLSREILYHCGRGDSNLLVCESVSAMPGQGVTSMFGFGRSVGVIEGVAAGLEIPVDRITAPEWHRILEIPSGATKDHMRALAVQHTQAHSSFVLAKHHNRADAALIGLAYIKKQGWEVS